jgi:hypothetical protein
MRARIAAAAAAIMAAGAAAACVAVARGAAPAAAPPPAPVSVRPLTHATGIVAGDLAKFDTACSCTPDLTARYIRWGESATSAGLAYDARHGAVPLAELEPYGVTLAQVADGSQDAYLTAFARQAAAVRSLVVMSFAPEANNSTYPWGYRHTAPAVYVRAWRHVVTVFREAGAANVQWAWIVNASGANTAPLAPLFPGAAYVQYAGIDGYATHPYTTFAGLFGQTVSQVRQLARMPVLITETGADADAGQRRWVLEILAGVKAYKLAGFIWFDVDQENGKDPYAPPGNRHDWAIDSNPAALAAFRAAVKEYGQ